MISFLIQRIAYHVVEHLQELHIDKIDLDTKGIAFELFMQDFFKGKYGQFFTPRNIVKFWYVFTSCLEKQGMLPKHTKFVSELSNFLKPREHLQILY